MELNNNHSNDSVESQATQLIESALAVPPEPVEFNQESRNLVRTQEGDNCDATTKESSMDSVAPPRRETLTRYSLLDQPISTSPNKGGQSGFWPSHKGNEMSCNKGNKEQDTNQTPSGSPRNAFSISSVAKGFSPDAFGKFTASDTGKLNGARAKSLEPPNTRSSKSQKLPVNPARSMPIANRYRRSPSVPTQDSFGDPVPQDPAERFLATTKQFDVPLSELGRTPTQQLVHGNVGPDIPTSGTCGQRNLPDCTTDETQKATGGIHTAPALITATPSNDSGSISSTMLLGLHNKQAHTPKSSAEQASQESTQPFDFDQTPSSFDRLLDKEAMTRLSRPPPELEATQPMISEATHGMASGVILDVTSTKAEPPTRAATVERSIHQRSISPQLPSSILCTAIPSSNPRSLLRTVNPLNEYRIAKLRQMHGSVDPPLHATVSAKVEIQPSHVDQIDPSRCISEVQHSPSRPKVDESRVKELHQRHHQDVDAMDAVPDSEPGRDTSCDIKSRRSGLSSSPLSRRTDKDSRTAVPDSLEVQAASEEDEDEDIPLSKLQPKAMGKTPVVSTCRRGKPKLTSRVTKSPRKTPLSVRSQVKTANVKGKHPARRNDRPKESTIVPSSAPEQDGSSSKQTYVATLSSSRAPMSKGPNRGHTTAASSARQRKRKRPAISDTESAEAEELEEEGNISPGTLKREEEEEEEVEPGDDHDIDIVSPSPIVLSGSLQKRRRYEDANSRDVAKGGISLWKRNDTSGPAKRSAKRARSSISTVRPPIESATRVFALWKQDGHYYCGTVHSVIQRPRGIKYLVTFDDGTDDEIDLKNMRRCELLVGDNVIIIENNDRAKVSDISQLESQGSIRVEADDGKGIEVSEVALGDIRIANRTLQSQWKERSLNPNAIVPLIKPKLLCDTATPSRQSLASLSGRPQRDFAKTGFVVTLSPKNANPDQAKNFTISAIKQHGAQVIDDWSSVFTMEGRHSRSNKRWIATSEDFCLKEGTGLDRVFLLADDANQKPKYLIALALGIPCLSFEWLSKATKFSQDWQAFLLPAGYSDVLGARISQLVDLDWGNCSEYLHDISSNRAAPKIFSKKTFLCIGAEFVPLHRSKKNSSDVERAKESARAVPWIILCMGASKVEAITDTKQVSPSELRHFDYIIAKDPDDMRPDLGKTVIVDVTWIKECLISSRIVSIDS